MQLAAYLDSGVMTGAELGFSYCRFPSGPAAHEMGCAYLTDGEWFWPEGLAVYVRQFAVRLPEEFLVTARGADWKVVPEKIGFVPEEFGEMCRAGLATRDFEFWNEWCRRNARPYGWYDCALDFVEKVYSLYTKRSV